MTIDSVPLRHVAEVRVSTVDKKSYEGEAPVRLCNYTDVYYQDVVDPSTDFMVATASRQQIEDFALRKGDTLLTKDSETADDIAVPAHVGVEMPGVVSGYHLALVRPRDGIEPRFLFRALQSDFMREQFSVLASGVTRFGLTHGALRSARVPVAVSGSEEQRRIADFLDDQVARLDAIASARRRQTELLQQRRVAAFTRAIRTDAPRWRLGRLLQLGAVGVVVNPSSYFQDEGVPFVHGYNVRDGWLDLRDLKKMSAQHSALLSRSRLAPGDVLVVRAGYPGRSAVVDESLAGGNCASVLLLRPGPSVLPEYLSAYFNSGFGKASVEAAQYGAAQGVVNLSDVLAFDVPLPPLREQSSAVDELLDALQTTEHLKLALGRASKLSAERKRALITAAIAGEFDVTTASGRGVVA